MTKRFGFTLAEVLITLGIIGVVAAMTMPTLINQTNGAQYKAAYKKALSAISQGVTLNVALEDEGFADNAAENILPLRMNVVNTVTDGETGYNITGGESTLESANNTVLFFNDSSSFAFERGKAANACTQNTPCKGYIDVNGQKGPNKITSCTRNGSTENCTANTLTVADVYPVKYYDQTILPNSPAAREVLYGK